MRGRKPKPSAQRALEGNPGHRSLNPDEPQLGALADHLTPPPELVDLPVAQAEWRRLAPLLQHAGVITEGDRTALLALCVEWARYIEARGNAYPRVVKAPSGYAMPNPWLAIQTKALAACLKLWPELGLTPSSRSRVSATGVSPDNEFAEFLEDEGEGHPHGGQPH